MNRAQKLLLVAVALLLIGMYATGSWRSSSSGVASISSFFEGLPTLFKVPPRAGTPEPAPLYKPVAEYEQTVVEAVKRVAPAVVSITISKDLSSNCSGGSALRDLPPEIRRFFGDSLPNFYAPCDPGLTEVGGGSGFVITPDGLILTNKHVVADAAATYTVFTSDGKEYDAEVLARDPLQDLAIIRIDGQDLPTVTLGNSDGLELGQTAIAIGNALGEFRNTVGVGVISGLGRSITALSETSSQTIQGVIQTDAAINPGNSGGPLINLRGEVVAVNVAVVQGAQNIGFALPINWAKHDIDVVSKGGQLKAPYVGVRYVMLTPDLANRRELDVNYGALLAPDRNGPAVVKGSPADKAGLKEGDVVLAIDDKSLDGQDFSQEIAHKSIGQSIKMDVYRAGRTIKVNVTLGERGS